MIVSLFPICLQFLWCQILCKHLLSQTLKTRLDTVWPHVEEHRLWNNTAWISCHIYYVSLIVLTSYGFQYYHIVKKFRDQMHSLSWVHVCQLGWRAHFLVWLVLGLYLHSLAGELAFFVCLSPQVISQFSPFSYGLDSSYIEGLLEFFDTVSQCFSERVVWKPF